MRLPSKKTIAVFFYDGPISHGVAFEGLLDDGSRFADRLLGGFSDARRWPQLVHIATDGESYGHHHRYGEMALSYALHRIETGRQAQLTNYGQFLELYPPDHWVEIVENSSWSCLHGIERWRSGCGCNSGGHPGWSQEWRAPLRDSLDWLRDTLSRKFEEQAGGLLQDAWAARNDYIGVVLDRSPENVTAFLSEHATHDLNHAEQVLALKLLEMQRNAMLMYTSCGWFFDELSGLETVQVLQYAGRAVQLAREVTGDDEIEAQFQQRLTNAKSNIPEHRDGAEIYNPWVNSAVVTMDKVVGHYALSSLIENYGDQTKVYCYTVDRREYGVEAEGRVRLAIGRARVHSDITTQEADLSFGVLHLGDHNISGGVREFQGVKLFHELRDKLNDVFARAGIAEVIRILDEEFKRSTFSLHSLFRDEQRRIVNLILKDTMSSIAASFRGVYENQAALMHFLSGLGVPVPAALLSAASIALHSQLQQALERPEIDAAAVKGLLREAETNHVALDATTLEFVMRKRLEEQAARFGKNPDDLGALKRLRAMLDLAFALPGSVTLWEVQNLCFLPLTQPGIDHKGRGRHVDQDPPGEEWKRELAAVRDQLHIQSPRENSAVA